MDIDTLIASMEFARTRLLGILSTIEKSGQDVQKVLSWRPGPGRAHIAWQAMHCAATHDRYFNVRLRNLSAKDENLVSHYAGGSIPSDANIPALADIRKKLEISFADALAAVRSLTPADLSREMDFGTVKRTIGETILLMGWHEAHHQGQIHLTWNLYKAANGVA
jgi:hypothetical protein